MASLSRRLQFVAAIGYGVLFALALTGAVRIACFLTGTPLSEHVAGNIFLIISLVAGSISGFVYVRTLKRPDSAPDSSLRPS
jgi:hypothetical protein